MNLKWIVRLIKLGKAFIQIERLLRDFGRNRTRFQGELNPAVTFDLSWKVEEVKSSILRQPPRAS